LTTLDIDDYPSTTIQGDLIQATYAQPYRWETLTRYYEVFVHPDLFGDLVLHKQWGGKGTRLGGTRVVAVGHESIARAFAVIEKERLRAGYSKVNTPRRLTA
jgi:hypothetical protein